MILHPDDARSPAHTDRRLGRRHCPLLVRCVQRIDLLEDDDELEQRSRDAIVNEELLAFARANRHATRDFDSDDWQALGSMIDQEGLSAAEAYEELTEDGREDDFEELVTRIEAWREPIPHRDRD
jgi:hypothetical protein